MFLIKVPFYVLTLILIVVFSVFYYFGNYMQDLQTSTIINSTQSAGCITSLNILRLKDYELIKPVLLTDVNRESNELEETKGAVMDVINSQKQIGNVSSVSMYLRKFTDGSWATINGDERFAPGSMMKIPILITYLKQAEMNPSLLNTQFMFTGSVTGLPHQNFAKDQMVVGKKYTVRELLSRMIVESDNDAVTILNSNLDVDMMQKLFSDLGLSKPDIYQKDFFITSTDCSKFLRILYNASYLNRSMSEYALQLLTQSKFKLGITKHLPETVKTAHKFGESGNNSDLQLHEGAIVYLNNNAYLLLIMTKGKEFDRMADCINSISDVVYTKFGGSLALN